jgi:hypothetical protein
MPLVPCWNMAGYHLQLTLDFDIWLTFSAYTSVYNLPEIPKNILKFVSNHPRNIIMLFCIKKNQAFVFIS